MTRILFNRLERRLLQAWCRPTQPLHWYDTITWYSVMPSANFLFNLSRTFDASAFCHFHTVCSKFYTRVCRVWWKLTIAQIPLCRLPRTGNFRGSRRSGICAYKVGTIQTCDWSTVVDLCLHVPSTTSDGKHVPSSVVHWPATWYPQSRHLANVITHYTII